MIWLILSFCCTFLSSLVLINRAEAWGFVDIPEERKVHTIPTPRTGGLAMACGTLVTIAVFLGTGHAWPPIPWQTIVSGAGFMLLGALDDQFAFHPRRKFLWFFVFALFAAWPWAFNGSAGTLYTIHLGEMALRTPRWVAYPFLTLWFLAVPNAVNIEDAINGYMGGFALIMLSVSVLLGVNALIPIGAMLGFLAFNWPKAKHFLGDAGSFGCGFMIAETLLRAGGNQRPLLVLILTAPISLDVGMGIIRRVRLKMSLFQADRSTCPHHMVNVCGQSHTWATLILWANAMVIAILAFRSAIAVAGYLALFILVLVLLNWTPLFKPQMVLDANRPGKNIS